MCTVQLRREHVTNGLQKKSTGIVPLDCSIDVRKIGIAQTQVVDFVFLYSYDGREIVQTIWKANQPQSGSPPHVHSLRLRSTPTTFHSSTPLPYAQILALRVLGVPLDTLLDVLGKLRQAGLHELLLLCRDLANVLDLLNTLLAELDD